MDKHERESILATLPADLRAVLSSGTKTPEEIAEIMRAHVASASAPNALAPVVKFAHFGCPEDHLRKFARMIHELPPGDQVQLTTCEECKGPLGVMMCAMYTKTVSNVPKGSTKVAFPTCESLGPDHFHTACAKCSSFRFIKPAPRIVLAK